MSRPEYEVSKLASFDSACPGDVPLDPLTSVSPTMLALLKLRARQYLRLGIEATRDAQEHAPGSFARQDNIRRADRFLGVADGTVCALYDTRANGWRYLRALNACRAALDVVANEGRSR